MNKKSFIVLISLIFLGMGSLLLPAKGLSYDIDFHI